MLPMRSLGPTDAAWRGAPHDMPTAPDRPLRLLQHPSQASDMRAPSLRIPHRPAS